MFDGKFKGSTSPPTIENLVQHLEITIMTSSVYGFVLQIRRNPHFKTSFDGHLDGKMQTITTVYCTVV